MTGNKEPPESQIDLQWNATTCLDERTAADRVIAFDEAAASGILVSSDAEQLGIERRFSWHYVVRHHGPSRNQDSEVGTSTLSLE